MWGDHGPEEQEPIEMQDDIDYKEEEPDYDEAAWRWERCRDYSMWDM